MNNLPSAMTTPDEHPWINYQIGGKAATGDTIKEIISISKKSIIFLDQDDNLQWEYDEKVCIVGTQAEAQAIDLIAQLQNIKLDTKSHRQALSLIGTALSCELEAQNVGEKRDFFRDAHDFIAARRTEVLQLYYLSTAFILAGLIAIPIIIQIKMRFPGLSQIFYEFLVAVALGALGAVVSVSQRFREIPIERYSSRRYTIIGGFTRIFFGSMFGAVILLFQKAGLLLTNLSNDTFAIASLAFIAGFSERFIPDLIVILEERLSSQNKKAAPPKPP